MSQVPSPMSVRVFPWLKPMGYVYLQITNHKSQINHHNSQIVIRYSLFCGSSFHRFLHLEFCGFTFQKSIFLVLLFNIQCSLFCGSIFNTPYSAANYISTMLLFKLTSSKPEKYILHHFESELQKHLWVKLLN